MNQVRKCIINSFYKTIPHTRIYVILFIIDGIILKINDNDIENVIEKIHDLREKIVYMLSFEKLNKDNNDNEKYPKHFIKLKREKPNDFVYMLPKCIIT